MRDDVRESRVDSVKVIAFQVMITHSVSGKYHGSREYTDLDPRWMKVNARRVERAPLIPPVRRANHAFIAKAQYFAASQRIDPAFGGTADLRVRFADVPHVLIGRDVAYVMIEKGSRILSDNRQLHPVGGLDIHAEAKLRQIVSVVNGSVAKPQLPFHAIAKLSAKLNPVGKQFVQPGYWKEPAIGIRSRDTKVCFRVGPPRTVRLERLGRTAGLLGHSAAEKGRAKKTNQCAVHPVARARAILRGSHRQ